MYENVLLDTSFSVLDGSLKRGAGYEGCVRTAVLSDLNWDLNSLIIRGSPCLEVIVAKLQHTHYPNPSQLLTPPLPFLRRLYWSALDFAASMNILSDILRLALSLEFLSIRGYLDTAVDFAVHLPPTLRTLRITDSSVELYRIFLNETSPNLTRLITSPDAFQNGQIELLPRFRRVELVPISDGFDPHVFVKCPDLEELCFDVWSSITSLNSHHFTHPFITCFRLYSSHTVDHATWPVLIHLFTILTGDAFPALLRVVLYGNWHDIVSDSQFEPIVSALKARFAAVEFPAGNVIT